MIIVERMQMQWHRSSLSFLFLPSTIKSILHLLPSFQWVLVVLGLATAVAVAVAVAFGVAVGAIGSVPGALLFFEYAIPLDRSMLLLFVVDVD